MRAGCKIAAFAIPVLLGNLIVSQGHGKQNVTARFAALDQESSKGMRYRRGRLEGGCSSRLARGLAAVPVAGRRNAADGFRSRLAAAEARRQGFIRCAGLI